MDMISDLDAFLEEAGEDVVLRRKVSSIDVDVPIRAAVRLANKPNPMVSGTIQDDFRVVTSMTKIRAAGWPGYQNSGTSPFIVDAAVPRRGDRLIIKGESFRVESVEAIAVANQVVRVVMIATGRASGA